MPLIKRFPPVTNQSSVDIWELARQTLLPCCFSLSLLLLLTVSLFLLQFRPLFASLVFCLTFTLFHSLSLSLHALSLFLSISPVISFLSLFLLFRPPSLSISLVLLLALVCFFFASKLTRRRKSQRCHAELNLCNNSQSATQPSSEAGVNWSWS